MFNGVPKRYKNAMDEPPFEKQEAFYVHGSTGTGKTHYACSIINISKQSHDGYSEIGIVNVPELAMSYRNASFADKEFIIKEYSKGMYIFDDIGAEFQSEFSQEFILMILEKRWSRNVWTGFTSNLGIGQLPYSDRIKSRIAGMVGENVHEIIGKDQRLISSNKDQPAG